jgi:hypothetical protein
MRRGLTKNGTGGLQSPVSCRIAEHFLMKFLSASRTAKRNFRSGTTAPFSLIAGEIIALTSHSNNVVFDNRVSVIIHIEHPHGKNGFETSLLM